METSTTQEPRSERLFPRSPLRLQVTVERLVEGTVRRLRAGLVDLSTGGAKLTINEAPKQQETIHVSIGTDDRKVELVLIAKIRWVCPNGENEWALGCAFDPPMPQDLIQGLATGGYVDRRTHEREQIMLDARVRYGTSSAWHDVTLLDYSAEGFCVAGDLPSADCEELMLCGTMLSGEPVEFPAAVRWKFHRDNQWVLGCQLRDSINRPLVNYLETAIEDHAATAGEISARQQRILTWAAGIVFALGLLCYLVVRVF